MKRTIWELITDGFGKPAQAKQLFTALPCKTLGDGRVEGLDILGGLESLVNDADFRADWQDIKRHINSSLPTRPNK